VLIPGRSRLVAERKLAEVAMSAAAFILLARLRQFTGAPVGLKVSDRRISMHGYLISSRSGNQKDCCLLKRTTTVTSRCFIWRCSRRARRCQPGLLDQHRRPQPQKTYSQWAVRLDLFLGSCSNCRAGVHWSGARKPVYWRFQIGAGALIWGCWASPGICRCGRSFRYGCRA